MSAIPSSMSAVAQDYVKVIWNMTEWSDAPVTTKALAERLGVGASTVSETVRRLTDQGLLGHTPYGAVTLTPTGERIALAMVRRHRLLESYLVGQLGYGWDEVHDEAEVLEHAVSDTFINRVDDLLGHPTRDPHGDPIPSRDGVVLIPPAVQLWTAGAGRWLVARVSDADPARLRFLAENGLVPDAVLEAEDCRDSAGVITLAVVGTGGAAPVQQGSPLPTAADLPVRINLGEPAAAAVWVVAPA